MSCRFRFQPVWVLAGCVLLGACAVTPGPDTPSHYSWDTSVSAACRNNPAQCAALTGTPSATGSGHAVATAGYTAHEALRVLDNLTQNSIEEALKKCADEARLAVLLRHSGQFKGASPTAEECREWVKDATGRRITWAQRLGLEMHEAALKCTEERLRELRPGGFSIEPRYRYDPLTGQKKWVSREEERTLEESGNGRELQGTLKPDVVLHAGDPLKVQAVYDYKFPCANTGKVPDWGRYPDDHPYARYDQGRMYKKALGAEPARVTPHWGVIR